MTLSCRLRDTLRQLRHSERAQGLVEYALIIVVVSLGTIAALTFLRGEIRGLFSSAGSSIRLGADGGAGGGGGLPLGTQTVTFNIPSGGSGTYTPGGATNGPPGYDDIPGLYTNVPPGILSIVGGETSCAGILVNGVPVPAGWVWVSILNLDSGQPFVVPTQSGPSSNYLFACVPQSELMRVTGLALANGGTVGTMDSGDTISITFSRPVQASSVCSAFTGAAKAITATISLLQTVGFPNVTSGGSCTQNVGTIGVALYNASIFTRTYAATMQLTNGGTTLLITLGTGSGGSAATGVAAANAALDVDVDISDTSGRGVVNSNLLGYDVTAASQRF